MSHYDFGLIVGHIYLAALFVRTETNPLFLLGYGMFWIGLGIICKIMGW